MPKSITRTKPGLALRRVAVASLRQRENDDEADERQNGNDEDAALRAGRSSTEDGLAYGVRGHEMVLSHESAVGDAIEERLRPSSVSITVASGFKRLPCVARVQLTSVKLYAARVDFVPAEPQRNRIWCSFRMQQSITTKIPASRAFSAAFSWTTPSCIQIADAFN